MLTAWTNDLRPLALVGLLALGACAPTVRMAAATMAPMSVCEVSQLVSYNGRRRVLVMGEYITDQVEQAFLHDERCSGNIIYIQENAATVKDDEYRSFWQLLYGKRPSSGALRINLVVEGVATRGSGKRARLTVIRYISATMTEHGNPARL